MPSRPHVLAWCLTALALAGCETQPPTPGPTPLASVNRSVAPPPATPAAPDHSVVVATVNGESVTRDEVDHVLYESYGVGVLAKLVELKLALHELAKSGQVLTADDVVAERQRSFALMFQDAKPEEYEQFYRQLKAEKHLTDAEFDLAFRTTAALRKLSHPQITGQVSEKALRQAFDILYGANRQIGDIAVMNTAEAADAHRRLAIEPFEQVAREMSVDPQTRANGGVWPPFSANTPTVPQAIKDAAFELPTVGDVSDGAIHVGDRFHVIKLLRVIAPKAVAYDQVKADVRRQVEAKLEESAISQYRNALRQVTLSQLQIDEPTLRKSWDAMIDSQKPKATLSPGDVARHLPSATQPATAPVAGPTVLRGER